MRHHSKKDPYNGFNDDRERRRALNARARYMALTCVTLAFFNSNWPETVKWLIGLFH